MLCERNIVHTADERVRTALYEALFGHADILIHDNVPN